MNFKPDTREFINERRVDLPGGHQVAALCYRLSIFQAVVNENSLRPSEIPSRWPCSSNLSSRQLTRRTYIRWAAMQQRQIC